MPTCHETTHLNWSSGLPWTPFSTSVSIAVRVGQARNDPRSESVRPCACIVVVAGEDPCNRPRACIVAVVDECCSCTRRNDSKDRGTILDAAFLVERTKQGGFELTFRVTGPWPPYSFANVHLNPDGGE